MSFIMGPNGPIDLSTEEGQAELQRQRDLRVMSQEEGQARVNGFIERMDAEDLDTFKHILIRTMGDPQDTYSTHMLGWVNARLWYQFGVCMACGKKHDDEIPTESTSS